MIRWGMYRDKYGWVIRRGKERLPVSRYKSIRNDEEELRKFVLRLNAAIDAKNRVELKHAFISPAMLDEYREYLVSQIPTERNALCEFQYLVKYFLNFFIGKLDLQNPLDWHVVHDTKWAAFLCGPKAPKSAKTKRAIVQAANRFMHWLHRKRPSEVPALEFKPLSRAKLKELEAVRKMRGEVAERKFIIDTHWATILSKCSTQILSHALLSYNYGLRRSEVLGLQNGDVKKGFLSVSRQLKSVGIYSALKGRDNRRVPHWFSTPSEAYKWVAEAQNYPMHPDTLTDRWNELMDDIGLDYDFHDLRHTFITRAARVHKADLLAVRDAAGHKSIKTTEGYLHDLPSSDDDEFIPEAG